MTLHKKRCVVFFTEGEIEDEFYGCLLNEIKESYNVDRFNSDKIIKKCLKGICRFDKKLINKYEIEIKNKYKSYDIIVFLCYDTDYFEFSSKPSVDWNEVNDKLMLLGAKEVYHIKAEKCIEDFLLYDVDGICNYLKIKKPGRIKGKNGVEKLDYLFSLGNRVYQKGYLSKDFIKSLNITKIREYIYKDIEPILDTLLSKQENNQ